MKKVTIKIPIYKSKLTIILSKDFSVVENTYKVTSLEEFEACVIRDKPACYVVAFRNIDLSTIAHEIIHIKNYLYDDFYIKPDVNNDEAEAMLVEFLFKNIHKELLKLEK